MRAVQTSAHERRALRIAWMVAALLFLAAIWNAAWAAKVTVSVTTATLNTDGSTIPSITQIRVTWGPCIAGAKDGDPATDQTSVQAQTVLATTGANAVPGAKVTLFAFPVGLDPVCLVAYNSDASGESAPTNVVTYSPLATPGKPITLGQPVTLSASSSSASSSSSTSASASASSSTSPAPSN